MHPTALPGGAARNAASAKFGAESTASCGGGHFERAGPCLLDRLERIAIDGADSRPGAHGGSRQRRSVSASAPCFSKSAPLKSLVYEIGRDPADRVRTPRSISNTRGAKFF